MAGAGPFRELSIRINNLLILPQGAGMAVQPSRGTPRAALALRVGVVGALVAAVAVTGIRTARASAPVWLRHELLEDRFTAGRLSGQSAWQACPATDTASALVPATDCGKPPGRGSWRRLRIDRASRVVEKADDSPGVLRARALRDLLFGGDLLDRRERAVAALEQAVNEAPGDADLLNDLAVAYLDLAELDAGMTYMVTALDLVGHALVANSLHLEARFNRALILQRLYLIGGSEQAWEWYLELERDPKWRAEAEQHLTETKQWISTTSWADLIETPPASIGSAERAKITARVMESLQAARESEFSLLGAWGAAVLAGDTTRARQLLDLAREISTSLTLDRSFAYALRAIDDTAGAPSHLRELAQGHRWLGKSFRNHENGLYDSAKLHAERAETHLRAGGSQAARWAVFYQAASRANTRDTDGAARLLQQLKLEISPQEPALMGKSIWGLGLIALRDSDFARAESLYRAAGLYIDIASEVENQGMIAMLIGEAQISAGQQVHADTTALRALRVLSPYRGSKFLVHNLHVVAATARAAGLHYAALELQTEAIEIAESWQKENLNSVNLLALGYPARARDHAALGKWDAANADLDTTASLANEMGSTAARVQAIVRLTRGQVIRPRNPEKALPLLKAAAGTFASEFENDLYRPVALYERALAERGVGRIKDARNSLGEAMTLVESQRDSFTRAELQIAFYETVEKVFDAAIELEAKEGDAVAAFAIMERGRVFMRKRDDAAKPAPSLANVGAALGGSTLLVEYALLDSSMVVWTAARGEPARQHVFTISRAQVRALVDQLGREISRERPVGRQSASAQLFALLIRPLAPQLEGISKLIIVPDRELHRVPFAGLWDATNRKHLIETHTLHTNQSAAFSVQAAGRTYRWQDSLPVLVVGNPELDPDLDMDPIPLSGVEADSVAGRYRRSVLLKDAHATRDSVQRLLNRGKYSAFHFAGHAVFIPDQPELSYLAMAGERGLMEAREIPNLRLSNLQVVVLSACSTLGQRATRSGPAAGLAYSFLRAGVPATVSSLWDVDDSDTNKLMVVFHRHLSRGVPPDSALRMAQVEMIGTLSPRAWAAFVYTGP
jgi:CHAT domain-containing protein